MIKRVFVLVTPLVILTTLHFAKIIDATVMDSNRFDIITVNSIFAGFLFSGLSLIVGLGANKTIRTLERIKEMDWIYFGILAGIICSLLSISNSLIIVFLSLTNTYLESLLKFLEIYFLTETVILFSISVRQLMLIIKFSRRDIIKSLPDDASIKSLMEKIK